MHSAQPKIRRRGRTVMMTEKDEAAFSAILKEAFPEIVFACIENAERRIRYAPTIEAASCAYVYVWLPEPGWTPEWEPDAEDCLARDAVTNLPKKSFRFHRCHRVEPNSSGRDLPVEMFSQTGSIFAPHDINDREVRSFIDKVFRLSGKLLTNRFARVDPDNGEVLDRSGGWFCWAGPDALQMCRTRKNLFIYFGGCELEPPYRRFFLAPLDYGEIDS